MKETSCSSSRNGGHRMQDDGEQESLLSSSRCQDGNFKVNAYVGFGSTRLGDLTVPLNAYERKCSLINEEIERMGMGKYQWYVWTLCGFGYMLDMLWIQVFDVGLSPIRQELGFGSEKTGNIATALRVGMLIGALCWGFVADLVGRQWAFNLTVIFSAIAGLSLGLADTYVPVVAATALIGFGVGGNIPIDTTIVLEFIPEDKRLMLSLLSIFQPIGTLVCNIVAAFTIPVYSCSPNFAEKNPLPSCREVAVGQPCCARGDNYGWRYLTFILGFVTLGVFLARTLVFRMMESPKYLVCRDQDEAAIEVLHQIAKVNGQKCAITIEDFKDLTLIATHDVSSSDVVGRPIEPRTLRSRLLLKLRPYRAFFGTPQMARLTTLTWLTYMLMYGAFTSKEVYIPRILALRNGTSHLSLRFTYFSLVFLSIPAIIGAVIGALSYRIPGGGRKYTMMVAASLMSSSLVLFAVTNSRASNILLISLDFSFQTIFTAILYAWTPEAYPAPIRATASGVAAFCGRVGGIIALVFANKIYADGNGSEDHPNGVLYLSGGLAFGCVLLVALVSQTSFQIRNL